MNLLDGLPGGFACGSLSVTVRTGAAFWMWLCSRLPDLEPGEAAGLLEQAVDGIRRREADGGWREIGAGDLRPGEGEAVFERLLWFLRGGRERGTEPHTPPSVGSRASALPGNEGCGPGPCEPLAGQTGTAQPGAAEPGPTDPGPTESGPGEPGAAGPGATESGADGPGAVQPGPGHRSGLREPLLDYERDLDAIYAAFLQSYGLDLYAPASGGAGPGGGPPLIETLHWWRFLALVNHLPPGSVLSDYLIHYRALDPGSLPRGTEAEKKRLARVMAVKRQVSLRRQPDRRPTGPNGPNPADGPGGEKAYARQARRKLREKRQAGKAQDAEHGPG